MHPAFQLHAQLEKYCAAHGYAGHSIRLVPHDSDKALMICDAPFHQKILTCICRLAGSW